MFDFYLIFLILSPIHKTLSLFCFHVAKSSPDLLLSGDPAPFPISVQWLYHFSLLFSPFSFPDILDGNNFSFPSWTSPSRTNHRANLIQLICIPNNYQNAKWLKNWHSFLARLNYKQRLIGCEISSGNIHSTVLETEGTKIVLLWLW